MAAAPQIHRVRAGIGGWTFAPWRGGTFYPEGLPHRRELAWASRRLPAVEINGTFYGPQRPATFAQWRSETPEGFVFSLKASRFCTHRRVLADAGPSVQRFLHGGIAELGDRLGPVLWQLPPAKAFDPEDVEAFLQLLPATLDGLPLRHGWTCGMRASVVPPTWRWPAGTAARPCSPTRRTASRRSPT